jgi:hypothetical protein
LLSSLQGDQFALLIRLLLCCWLSFLVLVLQGQCTYPEALNYSELAIWDDGTCSFPAPPEPEDCPKDLDGDELIGVGDILVLLADFGMSCPE